MTMSSSLFYHFLLLLMNPDSSEFFPRSVFPPCVWVFFPPEYLATAPQIECVYFQHLFSYPSAQKTRPNNHYHLPPTQGNSVVFLFIFAVYHPCLPSHCPLADSYKRTAFLYFRRNGEKTGLPTQTSTHNCPNCSLPVLFPSCPLWGKSTCFSDASNTAQHHDSLLVWPSAPPPSFILGRQWPPLRILDVV